MQRVIIFAMVLSMAALAPTPALACALFSSQIAECETASNRMQCDGIDMQMGVQDDVSHLSISCQSNTTCCHGSQSLQRPESRNKLDDSTALTARVSETVELSAISIAPKSIPVFTWRDLTPATIQSLLCTFLI